MTRMQDVVSTRPAIGPKTNKYLYKGGLPYRALRPYR